MSWFSLDVEEDEADLVEYKPISDKERPAVLFITVWENQFL